MDATDDWQGFEPVLTEHDELNDPGLAVIVAVMNAHADNWNNLDVADQRRLILDEYARRGLRP